MKFKFLLLILVFWHTGIGQISVSSSHVGKLRKIKKENFKRFKKTKTIFVLSNIYDKATYDSILKASWHVTPFEVVREKDFNYNDYGGNQYSYARIAGYKTVKVKKNIYNNSTTLHTYVEIVLYDFDRIKKKLDKMSPRRRAENVSYIFDRNKDNIAQILLLPTGEFAMFIVKVDQFKFFADEEKTKKKIIKRFNNEDVFMNYKPGFLKNYFQKTSNLIQKEQDYWLYSNESLPELKNLKRSTLYIPDFVSKKYRAFKGTYKEQSEKYIDEVFKDYDYKYQIISSEDLNKRIMNNDPIYYLMYVRVNSERFLSVVNAQTGEVVYRAYHPMGYNLKSKFIKKLNKAIKEAAKKHR